MKALDIKVLSVVLQGGSVIADELGGSESTEDHRQLPRSKRQKIQHDEAVACIQRDYPSLPEDPSTPVLMRLEEAELTALSSMANAHRKIANMVTVQVKMKLFLTEMKMCNELGMNEEARNTMVAFLTFIQVARRATVPLAAASASLASASSAPPVRKLLVQEDPDDPGEESLDEDLSGNFGDGDGHESI
jgi:hypothetical protein